MDIELRGQPAGLAYKLLTSLVVPRPIAWVSSQDPAGGINLAPFSFFNVMGAEPPIVVIGVGNGPDGRPKHTGQNIEATREFVVNLVTEELIAAMNLTAADFPAGQSELDAAGLHAAPSRLVSVPRVAEARASLECVLQSFQRIGANNVIIGEVVALHLADGLADGSADVILAGREWLRDPHFALRAATELGDPAAAPWPAQYLRAMPR